MFNYIHIYIFITQLAGAVEYTDCTSEYEDDPTTSVVDISVNNLMVRLL